MARTHGHRTDSACRRQTPCLHRLRTASVRLRTVSVRIGTASTTGFPVVKAVPIRTETEIPLSKRSQYGLKRYANGLKRYANGASTASIYSRLSPSFARVYGPFSMCSLPVEHSQNGRHHHGAHTGQPGLAGHIQCCLGPHPGRGACIED